MEPENKLPPTVKQVEVEPKKKDETYVCEDGLVVHVQPIPPMLLQKVMNSVKMPERPTYEARTISGRTEVWPIDESVANTLEHGQSRWEHYTTMLNAAQNEQNERVTMAAFLFGTKCDIPENGWDKQQEFLGLNVPTDPDMRRAHYLATELSAKDIAGLMQAVMGTLQLPEGVVADAEDSFRRAIRD